MNILLYKVAVNAHQKMASSYLADTPLICIRWTPRASHTETFKMKVRVTGVKTSFDLRQLFFPCPGAYLAMSGGILGPHNFGGGWETVLLALSG